MGKRVGDGGQRRGRMGVSVEQRWIGESTKRATEGPERISAVAEVGAGLEREEGKQVEIWRGMSWERTEEGWEL